MHLLKISPKSLQQDESMVNFEGLNPQYDLDRPLAQY